MSMKAMDDAIDEEAADDMGSPIRHQAIEAAKAQKWCVGDEDGEAWAERTAEVVMDLAEPLIRDLVRAMEEYRDRPHVSGWTEPLARAKEALGE